MESNSSKNTGGVTFAGLLAIVFIVLKLCKVINWSWIWVLSPIWSPLAIVILLVSLQLILKKRSSKRKF